MLLLGLLLGPARADDSLLHARRAQALLGAETWCRVIRIENDARPSAYPRTVHALVFEFLGRLWFYCDVNGTQSFSLHAGRLDEEKANFAPLLRDIEPGFTRWSEVRTEQVAAGTLPNGCFIESVALLRARMSEGAPIVMPKLLSYYIDTRVGLRGHTVLVYRQDDRALVCDPARPRKLLSVPLPLAADALECARVLDGPEVLKAQFLPIPIAVEPALA